MARVRGSRLVALMVGLCLVGLTGCNGSEKTSVSGTVKFRGRAPGITGLRVVFLHTDGTQVVASVDKDGTYKADGVPTGSVKVCFAHVQPPAAAGTPQFPKPGLAPDAKPNAPAAKATTSPIPRHLRDTSTSNLTFKVEAGQSNTFDYNVTP